MHLGTRYPSLLAEQAAVNLLDLVGMDNGKCICLSSGSEAVEFGVQAARRHTEKPLLLTFSNSYLGAFGSAGSKSSNEWRVIDWSACTGTEAVAMRPEIAERLESSGFRYAQSHQNDPLGCSVANEVIAILRDEHWVDRGNTVGTVFLEGLKRLADKHEVVREARGRGLLLGPTCRLDDCHDGVAGRCTRTGDPPTC